MKKMPENDLVRLKHMLDAALKAQSFMIDKAKIELENDDLLAFAVVRALEIVGEAANQITDETQAKYPHIQWQDIIGMRNVLIHAYFDIDIDIVWRTTQDDIPMIISQIEEIIDTAD